MHNIDIREKIKTMYWDTFQMWLRYL